MIEETLKAYKCNLNKPIKTISNLSIYEAQHKETATLFTIKIVKKPYPQLITYLYKLKATNSEYTIKINEILNEVDSNRVLIIQQHAPYGTLKKALTKCKRLEDEDGVFMSKCLLNGHMDLLKQGIYWSGDQNDIEFTDTGIKLSWNNTLQYSDMINPFPEIIQRICIRPNDLNVIIPFPTNKIIADLIKVSRQNASQMSLHPLLKKREKVCKKKGKGWVGLKQYKVKGQYFLELSYLAVSSEHGFVRVKIFESGKTDYELLKISQTKPSFVKILEYFDENGFFTTISEYANDGTVQNYVKRLKNANIALKQSQIQFFFASLIEPLKFIHKNKGSFNMLHIKNIYIENGIPKIGQPVPLTQSLVQTLKERSQVPDFYHKDFKVNPEGENSPPYDTYSLGVLLYKLMYTQYPIFPEGKVHIPTTPSYKKQLKTTLQLFLNTGGTIQQLQRQIEVSEDVKNQIKQNQRLLDMGIKVQKKTKVNKAFNQQVQQIKAEEGVIKAEGTSKKSCIRQFCQWLTVKGKDTQSKYEKLYKSQFSAYRKCTIITLVLLMYTIAFFAIYLNKLIQLFAHTQLFTQVKINILGVYHTVVTPNYNIFMDAYTNVQNTTLGATVIENILSCKIDNKGVYYDFIKPDSSQWYTFLALSLATMIIILILKGILLYKYSTAQTGYYYYNDTIEGQNQSKFALSTYVYSNLFFAMTLYCFYTLYNYIYNEQHLPCFGGTNWTSLTSALFSNRRNLSITYLPPIFASFILNILSFLQCTVFYNKIKYDKIINPIFIYSAPYIALFILMRVGALTAFNPSFLYNKAGIIGSGYMNFVGYFPELLVAVQILICYLVDLVYYKFIDGKIQKFILDNSVSDELINEK